jgi:hypothetical protein
VEHYPLANGQLVANKDRLLNSQITKSGTGDISDWAAPFRQSSWPDLWVVVDRKIQSPQSTPRFMAMQPP